MTRTKFLAALEFAGIFIGLPCIMYFHATRWNVHALLWLISLGALVWQRIYDKTSWHELWHGHGWDAGERKKAVWRFLASTAAIILLTQYLAPYRMLTFPMQRPGFWLIVMVLYPILSVIPQEFVFRSYFFRRYEALFGNEYVLTAASALSFAFMHIVFHNWVSPSLCLIAGTIFATSYRRHRSLKWAVIEHSAYGCMVFTVGIGFYFLVGGGSLR
ncbi:MAG TPA: CPBP family intramembrane glutamic endopeptidase [Alphaproteobacteria bacterium]|nr:CPBP family intramembrane glutamic endopeptidase [Alphaproteobacteria bacterium]